MSVPLATNASTKSLVSPLFTAVQLAPLLVDKNTPLSVPAKTLLPLTINELIIVPVKPLLAAVQLVPLLEDTNTPPPYVPTNTVVSRIAIERISLFVKAGVLTDF